MSGDSTGWELFGSGPRQLEGRQPAPAEPAAAPIGPSWIALEDRPAAAEFQASHRGHRVEHVRHETGFHALACFDCRAEVFVDVPISNERFDGLPAWPPAAEEGPRFSIDDVISTLRAVDQRLRRVEQELRRAGA